MRTAEELTREAERIRRKRRRQRLTAVVLLSFGLVFIQLALVTSPLSPFFLLLVFMGAFSFGFGMYFLTG
ncbi:MAG: hypothetical protein DRN96_09380 [Thermoproteota archaeon]|nr:MAG: hypothetical protein DRN96_09380 [Candidatus Korarchaeota archaeon]RLG54359.1 MAG: hypothetical protein DRN99_05230 [Candidatus Korarchaeota archaeon]